MRILLAFNGSKLSEAALHAVASERRPENTKVNLLGVIPLDVTDAEAHQAQVSLDSAGKVLRTTGFQVETTVLRDIAIETIVGVAKRMGRRFDRAWLAWSHNGETMDVWQHGERSDTWCPLLRRACQVSS